jgi:RNA polymerase sigma factor (sigma-70 family)
LGLKTQVPSHHFPASIEVLPDPLLARWGLKPDVFAEALARSTAKAFTGRTPTTAEIERYQRSLHLADLALACACMEGHPEAWDHFVLEFRPVLYRAADAIDRSGGAREAADALYGELYSKSLFRYFHGRSSLATWLRSLVSQRYVDRIREQRRLEPLPEESSPAAIPARPSAINPDHSRFVAAMQSVLAAALAALEPRDRLRLRCYYAQEMTLAQIGRVTREHEATVSRQLARVRKSLRADAERRLREEHRFSNDEIAECFSSISDDAGTLDLGVLLADRKESPDDRSKPEDVS